MEKVNIITYVLDDDKEDLEAMGALLSKVSHCNYELHTESESFIESIQEGVHIAVIDYRLNGLVDGVDVGAKVLEKNPLCFMILYTGYKDPDAMIRAVNTGFRYIVFKHAIDAIEQVVNIVEKQMSSISQRIYIWEKYQKHIRSHENKTTNEPSY